LKGHKGEYTYEAEPFHGQTNFSFLPLNNGKRILIDIKELSQDFSKRISDNIHGKYPVQISNCDLEELLAIVNKRAKVKVLSNITFLSSPIFNKKKLC